jgi:hypothetical protein
VRRRQIGVSRIGGAPHPGSRGADAHICCLSQCAAEPRVHSAAPGIGCGGGRMFGGCSASIRTLVPLRAGARDGSFPCV